MSWTPLGERFTALPLILSGPLLRRVEPQSVTAWLALKEPRMVTLRVYARNDMGGLVQQFEGTHHTIRLGNHLHIKWTAEKKVVMQRLWYYTDDAAQLLLKTDYHDTLELPEPNAAPPLP